MTCKRNLLFLSAAGVLTASLLVGCSQPEKTAAQGPPATVPVTIATVEQKDVPITLRAIGNVEAFQTVGVKSQISGELQEVHFREGQDVTKGQLLFSLDQRQLKAELARVEGNLRRDEAQAKNARVQAERYAALLKEGVVAQQQYDQFVSNADALDATVIADRAAVEYARLQLQYTRITAPITGRTGNLDVDRGNIVKANDINLVTINQVTPVNVLFSIPEQQLPEVKRYMAARTLRVDAATRNDDPSKPAGSVLASSGQLSFIDNTVDPETGTIKLKGTFQNSDRTLWPGQFVDVVLTLTTEPRAIVVPQQAVQSGQKGSYVFVVSPDNTADMRPVTVKRTSGNDIVIATGLQPGERVVTDGQLRLTRGAKVEMKRAPTSAAPGGEPAAGSGSDQPTEKSVPKSATPGAGK
ncbi:MAG TPA: efflux RND transporter periplasmic adaptor subunit [Terriglobales bacterium]|nr:efflux RND transporter periplasmic adaptor subunit [Terriglobales bacterium]